MSDVLAICCGGLGADQTWQIQQALAVILNIRVVSAGNSDGYQTNLAALITPNPATTLALICHSFGCETGIQTCQHLAMQNMGVDYLALLDPVSFSPLWAKSMPFPTEGAAPMIADLWYSKMPFFVRPAQILGGPQGVTVDGTDHNSLCHNQAIIAEIVSKVTALIPTPVS